MDFLSCRDDMDVARVAAARIARSEPVVLKGPTRPMTSEDIRGGDFYDVELSLNVEGPGIAGEDLSGMDEEDLEHLDDQEHRFTVRTDDWFHQEKDPSVGYMSAESYPQRTEVVAVDGLWLENRSDRSALNGALEAQIKDYDWTSEFEERNQSW